MNAVAERIMQRVVVDPGSGCFLWEGTTAKGYGRTSLNGRPALVHRVMYEAVVGPIPEGLQLDHLCRRRECCRPEHLEAVTSGENTRCGTVLITHCPQGHPYDDRNTRIRQGEFGPQRACNSCDRDRVAEARSTEVGAEANRTKTRRWYAANAERARKYARERRRQTRESR